MNEEKLQLLAEQGHVEELSDELDFVRAMYRSGDITPQEYARDSSFIQLLIDRSCDNANETF